MKDQRFSRLDLNLLAIFDAIIAEGSLTKAGRRLGITQSAVSHALGRLRELTDDTLFERTGRGVRPTPVAKSMAKDVAAAIDLLRASLRNRKADGPETLSARTFHLDIPGGLDAVIVPELAALAASHPEARFRISGGRARSITNELRFGETWLALDAEPVEKAGYVSELLFEDPLVLIARRDHPRLRTGLTPALFSDLAQVALMWGPELGETPAARLLDAAGLQRMIKIGVPNLAAIPPVVAHLDLVATMSLKMARGFARSFPIEIHELPPHVPPVPIYMVWHESFSQDDGHAWLRRALKEVCERL